MMTRKPSRLAYLVCAALGCAAPQPPPTSAVATEPEAEAEPPSEPVVASEEDVQYVTELAEAICDCVRAGDNELECVREVRQNPDRRVERSDPRVEDQIQKAQTCMKLAKIADQEDQALLQNFFRELFRS